MITTRFYDGINHTPAVELLARGQYELITDRLSMPQVMMFWDDQAIVGFEEIDAPPVPVGVISFSKPWGRTIDIRIGYVLPEFRHRGIYRAMWDALVAKAQELEVAQIAGTTHMHNVAMKHTAEALGRQVMGYVIRYEVPAKA